MAQYKPIGNDGPNADTSHEMRPVTEHSTIQGQSATNQQLPPYAGYTPVPAPATFQQASNNNVVVATQPTAMPAVTVVDPQLKPRPMVMIVTIVLTAVCLVQQCWPALVCLAPALIAAVVGYSLSDSGSAEQRHTARAFHAVAVCCNVATVVYYILAALSLVITLAVVFGTASSYSNNYNQCCYRSSYDYHTDCSCY